MISDRRWMGRALRLASLSLGITWPNPGVGCVIVKNEKIIGEGRHQRCGDVHGEVAALDDCRARGNDPRGATAYVTLAPCMKQGRQPPCVDALIAAGIARVVTAIADPNQEVAAAALRARGIAYEVGCLGDIAEQLHGGFLMRVRSGRPRFTGKWAMTLDGYLATASGQSNWISGIDALRASRRRRRVFDGILIGAGTASRDDPQLLADRPRGNGPVRIVVAKSVTVGGRLLASIARAPVWLVHDGASKQEELERLRSHGVVTIEVQDSHNAPQIAAVLGEKGLNDVLIEGGATMHGAWLRAGLYDRLEIYLGTQTIVGGMATTRGRGVSSMVDASQWIHESPARSLGGTYSFRLRK
jgi:diaminohydroxyphosphoribosylaminopyrimidine deaminase/5-amino-6-(5-phosphoribosylamino)uracil reductase